MAGGYLFVVPWRTDAVGGVSVAVQGLASAIAEFGELFPVVLVLDWLYRRVTPLDCSDLEQWCLRVPDPFAQAGIRRQAVAVLIRFPLALFRLARFLHERDIQVINYQYPGLHCLAATILRRMRIFRGRIILSFHGLDVSAIIAETHPIRCWLWRHVLSDADALVACSGRLVTELERLPGISRERVVLIHNGVDLRRIRRFAAAPVPAIAAGPYLLSLATYERKKGLDILLEAFAKVAVEWPAHRLVLSGRSGDMLEAIRRRVVALGIEERVTILVDTPQEAAIALLSGAQALLLPSRVEPFGLVVLEAAALGIPVAFTSVCGVGEVLPRGLAIEVPPEDSVALAAAIRTFIVEPKEASARAQELQRFVEGNLSWTSAARRYLRLGTERVNETILPPFTQLPSGPTN